MSNFETKKSIVEAGGSRIFAEWSRRSGITAEEFIEGLRWLCDDPCDGGVLGNRLTRELGCVARDDGGYGTPDDPFYAPPRPTKSARVGLHKLVRVYSADDLCTMYDAETHELWTCDAARASINARDRI